MSSSYPTQNMLFESIKKDLHINFTDINIGRISGFTAFQFFRNETLILQYCADDNPMDYFQNYFEEDICQNFYYFVLKKFSFIWDVILSTELKNFPNVQVFSDKQMNDLKNESMEYFDGFA